MPDLTVITSATIADKAEEVRVTASGKAYKWGGRSTDGFDCSGFVSYVLKAVFGKDGAVYDMLAKDFAASSLFETVTAAAPGVLICFAAEGKSPTHVGIIHDASGWIGSQSSTGVAKVRFDNPYWKGRTATYRRVKAAASPTNSRVASAAASAAPVAAK